MRSRTSRGVPEWSGGKDLYMGSHHTVTGIIRGLPVFYRDHRRGSGGPPGRSTCPGGPYGLFVERDQPLSGLGASPLRAHAPRVWGNPKGGRPPCLGGQGNPPGRRPLLRLDLRGPAPLSLAPIYICGGGRAAAPKFWCSPPPLPSPAPLPRCLAKPCKIAPLLLHHHAVVLLLDGVFPNLSLSPCWIKAWETSPGCTCIERGGAVVWRLDRNQPRSESLRVRRRHPHSCNASA